MAFLGMPQLMWVGGALLAWQVLIGVRQEMGLSHADATAPWQHVFTGYSLMTRVKLILNDVPAMVFCMVFLSPNLRPSSHICDVSMLHSTREHWQGRLHLPKTVL